VRDLVLRGADKLPCAGLDVAHAQLAVAVAVAEVQRRLTELLRTGLDVAEAQLAVTVDVGRVLRRLTDHRDVDLDLRGATGTDAQRRAELAADLQLAVLVADGAARGRLSARADVAARGDREGAGLDLDVGLGLGDGGGAHLTGGHGRRRIA